MKAYGIKYSIDGKVFDTVVDASNKTYARRKIARRHKVDEKKVKLLDVSVIGYF